MESKTRVLVFIILFLKIHRISLEITKLLIERSCSSVRIVDEIPVFLPSSYSTSQLYQCYTVMSSARNLLWCCLMELESECMRYVPCSPGNGRNEIKI